MPYKLRKAPKRDLYWVVSEDGTKRSKEPIPLERAKAQMRALYSSERMRGGEEAPPPPPPTFQEYLDSTGFKPYGAENLNRNVITPEGNEAQRAITNPDDVIKFDKARNVALVSGATPRAKYEKRAEQMAKLGKPIQSYDKYLEQLTANAKSRSTTNASAEGRQKYYLKKQEEAGKIQKEYYEKYPDQQPVTCDYLEDGSRGKEQTTMGECRRRNILGRRKGARENNGAFINALVDLGDFASNTLMPLIPGASQIAAPIYQALAPPGSQYYTDAPVTDKLLNAAVGATTAAMKMKGKGRPIKMSGGRKGEHPIAFANRILSEPRLSSKKQMSEAKRIKKLEGAGFFGDFWNAAKSVGKKIVSVVSNVVSGKAIRSDYPPYVRSLLAEIGDKPITEIFVRREPLKAAYDTALNVVTRGKWSEGKKKYAYDNLFHLGMEVIVKMSDQDDIYKRYVIEKNDVINIEPEKKAEPNTEKMKVTMGGTGHTINTLLNGGKQILGSKFFPYDAFTNNCQDFIISLLTGSGLGDDAVRAFVKQPLEGIVANLPSYTSSIARGITDLGGVVNTARYGQGGLHPSRELAAQFKKWGVNPVDYLAEAKKKAKEAGLADKLLGFSSDAKHKLQIPNRDGKMIRFGATGLGDYILYTLSKNPEAKEHRKHYLQRAMKIKGDWANDPYSPNSLSVSIQW